VRTDAEIAATRSSRISGNGRALESSSVAIVERSPTTPASVSRNVATSTPGRMRQYTAAPAFCGNAFPACPAPRTQQTTQVGTGRFDFRSCDDTRLDYAFTAGANAGRTGTLALRRVGPQPPGCG
jgi:hypothetical protein